MKKIIIAASLIIAVSSAVSISCKKEGVEKDAKFLQYQKDILAKYAIDINNFKDSIKGGIADGKPVTKYDLGQLMTGIKVEQEHTSDKFIALEVSADHLEEIPDYYTRLDKLEKEFESSKSKIKAPAGKTGDADFKNYQKAIKEKFQIDIADFKDSLKGGIADGKPVTKYDLKELLMGIKVEREHTADKFKALEISTDHLEEIPDYYTRIDKMEVAYEKETGRKK
jgi:hypothetical protein